MTQFETLCAECRENKRLIEIFLLVSASGFVLVHK